MKINFLNGLSLLCAAAALALAIQSGASAFGVSDGSKAFPAQNDGPKTFAPDPAVSVEKVFYTNRLDITLAGDLYTPKNLDRTKKHAAIIVGHQYGAVKEQAAGLYAQELAKRGFVALAAGACKTRLRRARLRYVVQRRERRHSAPQRGPRHLR